MNRYTAYLYKEEVKCYLFADDMILCVETLCQPTILFLWALTKAIVLTPSLHSVRVGWALLW